MRTFNLVDFPNYLTFEHAYIQTQVSVCFLYFCNNGQIELMHYESDGSLFNYSAFEFIENAKMQPVAQKPEQAKATARTFAKFTAAFNGFNDVVDALRERA